MDTKLKKCTDCSEEELVAGAKDKRIRAGKVIFLHTLLQ